MAAGGFDPRDGAGVDELTVRRIVPQRWRVPAPAARDLVRWPAEFGRRFIVFVDTEEEFDWSAPFSREARAVTATVAIPEAQRRFADRGVAPVYLADYPIAADERSAAILRAVIADGRSAVGAQLHPWVNPPDEEEVSPAASFAGNLPEALEAAKLDRLTDVITRAVGVRPVAFRAGRYGLGPATLRLLAARGYRLDGSMRSWFDYRADGGPDFAAIGPHAFRPAEADGVIELPPTTLFTGSLRSLGRSLHHAAGGVPFARGALARAGLLSRVPLTPEGVPIEEACEAVRVAVSDDVRVLSLSFHSPSLVPGHTPYVRDAADLAHFWRWWGAIFDTLASLDIQPVTLDELLAAAG